MKNIIYKNFNVQFNCTISTGILLFIGVACSVAFREWLFIILSVAMILVILPFTLFFEQFALPYKVEFNKDGLKEYWFNKEKKSIYWDDIEKIDIRCPYRSGYTICLRFKNTDYVFDIDLRKKSAQLLFEFCPRKDLLVDLKKNKKVFKYIQN